jgi:hypothetical protein
MKKTSFIAFIFFTISTFGQLNNQIIFNKEYSNLHIKENKIINYKIELKKDFSYLIIVKNKGINVAVEILDKNEFSIDKDYSYDETDPAKISFSPNVTGIYTLRIKLKDDSKFPKEGNYSLLIKTAPQKLKKFKYSELIKDYEFLKNAYIETHVGLWYNNYHQFDSLCNVQKAKIKDKMNALELYKILAPITSFTKEGHCKIQFSEELNLYSEQNFKYLPFIFKIINGRVYILNENNKYQTKGLELLNINGNSIENVMKKFIYIHPSDGYNVTGKFHRIERKFSEYYSMFFENNPTYFNLELYNPKTKKNISFKNINSINFKSFYDLEDKMNLEIPNRIYKKVSEMKIDSSLNLVTLSFNDFSLDSYENGRIGFQKKLDYYFKTISKNKVQNLIIDVRRNEGGEQGMEDHLLSYLIDKEYIKYRYVEIPSFDYSFIKHTQKSSNAKKEKFVNDLKEEFYLNKDGRYLNKPDFYNGDKPNENNFKGNLYILINGLTFSGGSEFASLAKNYTNAKFIGEETGGGFYGNSSGIHLYFTLPNTKLTGRIPICKFVLEQKETIIPFGRGVLPDYEIQPTIEEYLNGIDKEMELTKEIITKK